MTDNKYDLTKFNQVSADVAILMEGANEMNKKYFMIDQVKPNERISFPGRALMIMSSGIFFSALIVVSASLFYVR